MTRQHWWAAALAAAVACSDPPPAGPVTVYDGAGGGADTNGDVAKVAADTADIDGAGDTPVAIADTAAETAPVAEVTDGAALPDGDWSQLFDPPDAGGDAPAPAGPVGLLYAHSAAELYRLDPAAKAFVLVGKWSFDKNAGSVTDIAVDQHGQLFAITHKDLFVCGVDSAKCKWLVGMPEQFYGMTLVPKGTVDPTKDALVGISQDGDWVQILPATGTAKLKKLGAFGGGWLCSGDAFSVDGVGTFATVKKATGGTDSLAMVDPTTGKVTKVVGDTGVKSLFGLAWWDGVVYAFSSDGGVWSLDTATGKATAVAAVSTPKGIGWWGAGVSTRAAGKPN